MALGERDALPLAEGSGLPPCPAGLLGAGPAVPGPLPEGCGKGASRAPPSSSRPLCGSLPVRSSGPLKLIATAVPSTPRVRTAVETTTTRRRRLDFSRAGTRAAILRMTGRLGAAGAAAGSCRPSARSRSSIRRAEATPRCSPAVARRVSAVSSSAMARDGCWTQIACTAASWWNQA